MSSLDLQAEVPKVRPGEGEIGAIRRWVEQATKEELVEALLNVGRDPLTNLLNRLGVDNEVARVRGVLKAYEEEMQTIIPDEIEQFKKESRLVGVNSIQVIALDLSGFKKYNDAKGEKSGDQVLKMLSRGLLKVFSRETDIHGRWGGDEFVVVAFNAPISKEDLERMQSELNSFLPDDIKTYFAYLNTGPDGSVDQKIQDTMDKLTIAKKTGPVDLGGRSLGGGMVYN